MSWEDRPETYDAVPEEWLDTGPGPCPICGGPTVMRRNRHTGTEFFGCEAWPRCRGTRDRGPING